MQSIKRTAAVAVSLGIIFAVTVVLSYFKNTQHGAQHLVFFYLLPTAIVAMVYGSVLSMFCAIAATLVAAFFLYDPIYSLYVEGPREVGELILFAGTAVIGAKCTAAIARPTEKYSNSETVTDPTNRDVRAAN
jgi:K+-sensing histidine kinase KdpD